MTAESKILDLRKLLAERYPPSAPARSIFFSTGISPLDQAAGGGLSKGALTELISPDASAGSARLIAQLLEAAQRDGNFLALIDGRDSFDPTPLGNERLRHLLWVRCHQAIEAVKAADLLLRDGNFPLVILDLVLNAATELQKIPTAHWYRLQRLIEPSSTALLILTRQSLVSSAQLKLVLENQWQLADLADEPAETRLRIRVRRALGNRLQNFGAG